LVSELTNSIREWQNHPSQAKVKQVNAKKWTTVYGGVLENEARLDGTIIKVGHERHLK
jgi:hypothetical protein